MSAKNERNLLTIPQSIIDDLVNQTDILETISRELKLKKQGKDYIAICPFHKEHSPSFTVSPDKQFYYCFGCGAGGNVMNFIMNYSGRTFISAIQEMAEKAHVNISQYLMMARADMAGANILPSITAAKNFFEESLRDNRSGSDKAMSYLNDRGITQEIRSLFALGYAGYGKRVAESLSEHQAALIEAGLLDKNEDGGVFSLFRDRLIMPIRDTRGKTIAISGRVLDEETKPKYRNSKETPHFSKNNVLYGLYESFQVFGKQKLQRVLVVEGQFDVMSCIIFNLAACAAMGSSISIQQLRLLLRHAEHVTFVFDGDEAGRKALVQVCSLLLEALSDLDVLFDVVVLPEKEDPNSLIGKDPALFSQMLDAAEPWIDALLRHMPEAEDVLSDRGRSHFAVAAVELAHGTRDPLLRYQLIEKAAGIAKMPVEALNERLVSFPVTRTGQAMPASKTMNDYSVRLIRMVWDSPAFSDMIECPELWVDEGDELAALIGAWVAQIRNGDYDTPLNNKDIGGVVTNLSVERALLKKSRTQVAGVALGRMIGELPPEYMSVIMSEEPEDGRALAGALSWHITSLCAGKAMQALTKKAGSNTMTDEDRENFTKLMTIRKMASQRTRTIDT